ncbi:protoporphyrinogen/coproporphyrinogen oxidase [Mycolicibacterium stellerae]|uniref:protoporphyrinogen/coproporphyrinogen oxidase n=1 Tax=Mycolicibacterium stellerae TaxID=2358193 RepID=UPI0013DE15E3|nr:NAD(P)/FAD-dependent oxidoreductase [Mycolicibacterium stellerae]
MKRVVIVGSGLAGLSAGYRLRERGWQVKVFESADRVGGRVLSESEDGFVFDVGPVIITDKYTEYMKLVRGVGLLDEVVDCAPQMGVVNGNELHILDTRKPLRSFLTTKLLPARAKVRLVTSGVRLMKPLFGMSPYDVSNRVQYDNESIESYADRIFGREINDLLIEGLARTMATSSRDRASVIEFFAGAVLASGKMQTVRGGLQLLPDRLADLLDVHLDSPVTAVHRNECGVEIQYQDKVGAPAQVQADACVIATVFRDAVEIYAPLKEHGAELLEATKDAGCITVRLTYDRKTDKDPFLIMVPTASSQEVGTLFIERVEATDGASAGTSHITAFIPTHSDDFAAWNDDRLIGVVRELVERLFTELCGTFRTGRLTRWSYASHRGEVGYYTALQQFLNSYPADEPVQVAGDYLATSGQESAVVAGNNAADRILAHH